MKTARNRKVLLTFPTFLSFPSFSGLEYKLPACKLHWQNCSMSALAWLGRGHTRGRQSQW